MVARRRVLTGAAVAAGGLVTGFALGSFTRPIQQIERTVRLTETKTTTVFSTVYTTVVNTPTVTDVVPANVQFGMLPGTEYAPLYVGMLRKIYEKYGLNIEELNFANPVDLVTALGTGDIKFGFAPSAFWLAAHVNQQLPITILAGVGRGGYYYAVRKDSTIKTVADMRGKKIGSRGGAALITLATMELLTKYGIDPFQDVEFVHFFGSPVEYLASLDRGEIDVISLWEPWAQVALARGHRIISSYDEIWPHHPECVLVGNAKFVRDNQKVTLNLIRGYKESVHYVYSNMKDSSEIVGKKFNIDPKVVTQSLLSQPVSWYLAQEEIERIINMMLRFKVINRTINVEQVTDFSFIGNTTYQT